MTFHLTMQLGPDGPLAAGLKALSALAQERPAVHDGLWDALDAGEGAVLFDFPVHLTSSGHMMVGVRPSSRLRDLLEGWGCDAEEINAVGRAFSGEGQEAGRGEAPTGKPNEEKTG